MKYQIKKILFSFCAGILFFLSNCSNSRRDLQASENSGLYSVSGMVTGLALGDMTILDNNGSDQLIVVGTGTGWDSFAFHSKLNYGENYYITVSYNPTLKKCLPNSNSGTVIGEVSLTVTCNGTASTGGVYYSVGGNITGLAQPADSVVIRSNTGETLTINGSLSAGIPFTFSQPYISGAYYSISMVSYSAPSVCSLMNSAGVVQSANVTSIVVICGPDTFEPDNTMPPPAGNTLALNSTGSIHTIDVSSDNDYYTINTGAADAGLYYIDVTNGSGGCNFDSFMELRDNKAAILASDDNSGVGVCPGIFFSLAASTTYYVNVYTKIAGQAGAYVVGVYKTTNVFSETFATSLGQFVSVDLTAGTSGAGVPYNLWNNVSVLSQVTGCGGLSLNQSLSFAVSGVSWGTLSTDSSFALVSSLSSCTGTSISTSLESVPIDLTAFKRKVVLFYDLGFKDQTVKSLPDTIGVQVKSGKTNGMWQTLALYQTDQVITVSQDITSYVSGDKNANVRFVYISGGWAQYAMVDNVRIYAN